MTEDEICGLAFDAGRAEAERDSVTDALQRIIRANRYDDRTWQERRYDMTNAVAYGTAVLSDLGVLV